MSKLAGKVAIVTGASKGIGASIAKHLAAAGASVVVNYATSQKGADSVIAEIGRAGGKAIAVQANVAKEGDIERLFSETKKAFGRIDILVNNAGVYDFAPNRGNHAAALPQVVRFERARPHPEFTAGGQALRTGRWKHHQHQFRGCYLRTAWHLGVQRDQGRG